MVDFNTKSRHRARFAKQVAQKQKETGQTEERARAEVMKDMRVARKASKAGKHEGADKVKAEVEAAMAGEKDPKKIEKAVRKAVARHYSQLKKARQPKQQLKQRADSLILTVHSQLWRPSAKAWWDVECQEKFEDIELLAAICEINLLKAPANFGEMFPGECKKYFDFLAKKRFSAADPEAEKAGEGGAEGKRKKEKSNLQKKFEEKKAEVGGAARKSDKDVLKEVITEVSAAEREQALTNVKRQWKPTHRPWFDETCDDSFSRLTELSVEQDMDLAAWHGNYKKFKAKNKQVCKEHFALLEETRKAFDDKQVAKEERKKETVKQKKEKDDAAAIPDGFAKGQNKKMTFDEENENVEDEGDIDQTIKKVDNKLKSLEKKEKKKLKKEKAKEEAKEERKKEQLDPKKLKKIEKEKQRRKRKKEAEEAGEATTDQKGEKAVVDFTEEDEEKENNNGASAPKKSKTTKKKKRSLEALV